MQNLLETGSAVDGTGFIQAGIDGEQRRQIDDGIVAEFLPDIGAHDYRAEPIIVCQELNGLHAEQAKKGVDGAIQREHIADNRGQHNPRKEVGQIDDGLERSLEKASAQLIEEDGEENGDHGIEYQFCKSDNQGVPEHLHAVGKTENDLKVFPSHPLRAKQALGGNIILERHQGTYQRDKNKDQQHDHAGEHHQVERKTLF